MDIVTVIQARMTSTRLKGKCLMKIKGKTLVEHVVEAAPDPKVVAIPNEMESLVLIEALANKVDLYMPPRNINGDDVLGRFTMCMRERFSSTRWVLRLTADCPMLTRSIVDAFLQEIYNFPMWDVGTIYTNRPRDPDGFDMELFSRAALYVTAVRAHEKGDREHVTPYMYRTMNVARLSATNHSVAPCYEAPGKYSVDTRAEFNYVKDLMEQEQRRKSYECDGHW